MNLQNGSTKINQFLQTHLKLCEKKLGYLSGKEKSIIFQIHLL